VVRKFNRWHFHIKNNWQQFKHGLIRRKDIDWDEIKKKKHDIKLKAVADIKSKRLQKIYAKESKKK